MLGELFNDLEGRFVIGWMCTSEVVRFLVMVLLRGRKFRRVFVTATRGSCDFWFRTARMAILSSVLMFCLTAVDMTTVGGNLPTIHFEKRTTTPSHLSIISCRITQGITSAVMIVGEMLSRFTMAT